MNLGLIGTSSTNGHLVCLGPNDKRQKKHFATVRDRHVVTIYIKKKRYIMDSNGIIKFQIAKPYML